RPALRSSWSLVTVDKEQEGDATDADLFQVRGEGEGGNELAGRGGSQATTRCKRCSKSRPGVDGISNTVHPLFIFNRWIEHVRFRSGRRRTRSSLPGGAAARELDATSAMAEAQVRRTSGAWSTAPAGSSAKGAGNVIAAASFDNSLRGSRALPRG